MEEGTAAEAAGRAMVPLVAGAVAGWLAWRRARGRAAGGRAWRAAAAAAAAAATAVAVLLLMAVGARGQGLDPALQAELDGFARGLQGRCEETCAGGGDGIVCRGQCACLGATLPLLVDPETLRGEGPPDRDAIVAFVEANRDAIVRGYGMCGVPLR